MEFLSLCNVSKRYAGVQALKGVDLTIREGEVHCLVGENGSGKSTLIKIIAGVERPEEGAEIRVGDQRIEGYDSADTIRRGIEVIYQDLSLFPNLSVRENIAMTQIVERGRRIYGWKECTAIAEEAMRRVRVSLPLDTLVGELPIAEQQLVAICRALTKSVKLLVMDEPTSSLTRKEIESLFRVVRELKERKIATLFVSHKLDEILQIADRITVIRDGEKVGDFSPGEVDAARLSRLMTDQRINHTQRTLYEGTGVPTLEVRGLTKRGAFADVGFTVHSGEILGITGLLGAGRTELALALFGIEPADSGTIFLDGRRVRIRSVRAAMAAGIGYVPENRLTEGLCMDQPISKNLVITVLRRLVGRLALIDSKRVERFCADRIRQLRIKVPSIESPVRTLSGGNQQRVVLGKWVAIAPKVLILDGPTIGVDVAAKVSIHELVREIAGSGVGVIIISDEVGEVLSNCDRVLHMKSGRIVGTYDPRRTEEGQLQGAINEG